MGKWVLLTAVVLAVGITPFAVAADGDPVRAGGRTTFTDITRILGNSAGYATQQSNLRSGDGGAARYGCRSSADNEFCLLSKNVGGGGSFRFQSTNSLIGGSIEVDVPQGRSQSDARPFTTNATGVATGLNADQVDGASADDLRPKFARVNAAGALIAGRGATGAAPVSDGTYDVTFSFDVTNCAYTATVNQVENSGAAAADQIAPTVVRVRTRRGGGSDGTGPADPENRPFSLVVSC
jgi:hypothetical protein